MPVGSSVSIAVKTVSGTFVPCPPAQFAESRLPVVSLLQRNASVNTLWLFEWGKWLSH